MSDPNTIYKEIIVNASQEHAFKVFTESFDSWWPRVQHRGKPPLKEFVLEPHIGGRWYEIYEDDSECDWGRVIDWEPPARFALTWQITEEYEFDPNLRTEVEVTFMSLGAHHTRVVLEHKYLDRFGENAVKIKQDKDVGWSMIMPLYAAAAKRDAK
jgi:uncharacterized protein YndB with AHSA1/START domain